MASDAPNPVVLTPATPSELLELIIAHHRYPTTILVCWSKPTFVEALVADIRQQLGIRRDGTAAAPPNSSSVRHPLQRKSLLQTAVSRHIRLLFVPSRSHLRAYLGTFSASDSSIPPPPSPPPDPDDDPDPRYRAGTPPMLLVYGLLELHRDSADWSAQGIGTTAAYLVEAAARNAFRAALVEPRGAMGYETQGEFLDEIVPVLSGAAMKDDGTWSGPTVSIQRVLSRWFEFEGLE
ncbi:hypothetical protein Trco_001744 [Trichoderma cornu-damae]|uniref:Uncharacterized protein n=1 Tax=Trichoderma cornu-damae TaxID=654480 RepID=A0A9P8QTD9_9HYPO|nr:hypothetical protein Trco_001744 [Trichoderma cornu-damae]